jgi:hypothetical protein
MKYAHNQTYVVNDCYVCLYQFFIYFGYLKTALRSLCLEFDLVYMYIEKFDDQFQRNKIKNCLLKCTMLNFRSTNGSPTQLFSTLMILKAACMHNQCYIDRLITTFMKVLHKMAREHLQPTSTETSPSKSNSPSPLLLRQAQVSLILLAHFYWDKPK